jgi:hypothetical protein
LKKAICLKLRIHDRPINTGSRYSSTVLCHTREVRMSTGKPERRAYDYRKTQQRPYEYRNYCVITNLPVDQSRSSIIRV